MAKTSPIDLGLRAPLAAQVAIPKPSTGDFSAALNEEGVTQNEARSFTDRTAQNSREIREKQGTADDRSNVATKDAPTHTSRKLIARKTDPRPAQTSRSEEEPLQDKSEIEQGADRTSATTEVNRLSEEGWKTDPDADPPARSGINAEALETTLSNDISSIPAPATNMADTPAPTIAMEFVSGSVTQTKTLDVEQDHVEGSIRRFGSDQSAKAGDAIGHLEHEHFAPRIIDVHAMHNQENLVKDDDTKNQADAPFKHMKISETATPFTLPDGETQDNILTVKPEHILTNFTQDTAPNNNTDLSIPSPNQTVTSINLAASDHPAIVQHGQQPHLVQNEVIRNSHISYTAIPIEIGLRALDGTREIALELSPSELGQMNVTISVNPQSPIQVSFVVEQQQTLIMLMQDTAQIRSALEQAGFSTSDTSLQFSLRQDTPSHSNSQHNGPRKLSLRKDNDPSSETSELPILHAALGRIHFRQLDLSV